MTINERIKYLKEEMQLIEPLEDKIDGVKVRYITLRAELQWLEQLKNRLLKERCGIINKLDNGEINNLEYSRLMDIIDDLLGETE